MDEVSLSPDETLRLIEEQRKAVRHDLIPNPLFTYVPWGAAWFVGYLAFFLAYGVDSAGISWQLALAILMGGQILAGSAMVYGTTRSSLRVKGHTSQRGAMYGIAWFVGMAVMGWVCSTFVIHLDQNLVGLLFSTCSLMIAAVLYMAGGAIWLDWTMFFVGTWMAVVVGIAAAVGQPYAYLLFAILVGGAFMGVGVIRRHRR
ncbi:hypothetical protein [Nonomuraea soli]|uniref:Uncharacterized protein n=1 Tax=Nonomuraea soli TaxID=1032476 RepID=A0A7W0HP60_9ACTN|nr:hypothetical protein [Nonomuraea soli]MBA2890530.1 hypothetical protein [Nonomuraea soli]